MAIQLLSPDSHNNPTDQSPFAGDVSPGHPFVSSFASLYLPPLPSVYVRATAQCHQELQVHSGSEEKMVRQKKHENYLFKSLKRHPFDAYLIIEVKKGADDFAHTYQKE